MRNWKNWRGLYKIRRKVLKWEKIWWGFFPWHKTDSFFGISLAAFATTIEYANVHIYDKIFILPNNRIKDGYAMLLLGPFVFAWWIISGLIFAIANLIIAPFALPIFLWTLVFEWPAATLVGDFEPPKPQPKKTKPKQKRGQIK